MDSHVRMETHPQLSEEEKKEILTSIFHVSSESDQSEDIEDTED